jgi:hypothetical protein
MEENEINPMLITNNNNNKRRHLSQTPIPSNGLILKKLSLGYITVPAVRNRRTVSEQFNRHDRLVDK